MAETGVHVLVLINTIARLRNYFHGQRVYVIGNIFLYWEEGKPKKRRTPDIMVIKGVDPTIERLSFKTWEEKAIPSFILEATSASTLDVDLDDKHDLYEELGVGEYFLFDPLGRDMPVPLCGFRLVNGKYQELTPDADGGLYSEQLGLKFIPSGNDLTVIDAKSGERLLPPEELLAEVERLKKLLQQKNGSSNGSSDQS
jgi:Uma2 family endonuclease